MSMRYQAGIVLPGYNPLKVTNAPTIGTATKGDTTASITFTAPSNIGGGAISSYTVVSTPGNFITTGASSPLVVTGLSNGTAYTFKVIATNLYGPSYPSAASNSVTPAAVPTTIGQAYGGGYYAGQISINADGIATHYLVVSDVSVGESGGLAWGPIATTTGVTDVIDGPTNTATLAALGTSYASATFCADLNTGGYTDWYLPAKDELAIIYYFLKPGTSTNNTSSGATIYSVSPQPISTNYTGASPAQTTATNFRVGAGDQEFSQSNYNTSIEFDANYKWIQSFDTGFQRNSPVFLKTRTDERTRAIRRVPV